jgi:hypothetical protein
VLLKRLSLLLVLLHAGASWHAGIVLEILALAGLLFPRLAADERLWIGLAVFQGVSVANAWATADNHKYLMAYWFVAMAIAHGPQVDRAARKAYLAGASRWLIALSMGFAVLAKLSHLDYLTGDFFHHALLFDDRFQTIVTWLGDIDRSTLHDAAHQRSLLHHGFEWGCAPDSVSVSTTPTVSRLARFLTAWTLGIELLIALGFLFCRHRWVHVSSHVLLTTFLLSTYAVATVSGFAWILTVLAFADAEVHLARFRWVYVIFLLILTAYRFPVAVLIG